MEVSERTNERKWLQPPTPTTKLTRPPPAKLLTEKKGDGKFTEEFEDLLLLQKPFPDVLVRTGGEKRISNFLLYQCAFSELFFIPALWPEFTLDMLEVVVEEFHSRNRRYGGRP